MTRLHARPVMERSAGTAAAFDHAGMLARALGEDLAEGHAGGTSDANLVAGYGIPVLDGLGPDGAGAHCEDERISITSLVKRTALIAMLLAHPPVMAS